MSTVLRSRRIAGVAVATVLTCFGWSCGGGDPSPSPSTRSAPPKRADIYICDMLGKQQLRSVFEASPKLMKSRDGACRYDVPTRHISLSIDTDDSTTVAGAKQDAFGGSSITIGGHPASVLHNGFVVVSMDGVSGGVIEAFSKTPKEQAVGTKLLAALLPHFPRR